MNVLLTPEARSQIELVRQAASCCTGFLMADQVGKYVIIRNLFPVAFDRKSIGPVYSGWWRHSATKVRGIFFFKCRPFYSEWFLEDMVLGIGPVGIEAFSYMLTRDKIEKIGHVILEEENE